MGKSDGQADLINAGQDTATLDDDSVLVDWIVVRAEGLWVAPGGFYLDPRSAVGCAVISHGHSDHARSGHGTVHATVDTCEIMRLRYGSEAAEQWMEHVYGEEFELGQVKVRLVPAGHVLGSAQVVMEYGGVRVVYTGDYKRVEDPTCAAFEPVACDVLITEATFGLPVFRHPPAAGEVEKLMTSLRRSPERAHVVGVYGLGKCQRLLALLRRAGYVEPVYLHGAMQKMCDYYQSRGVELGELRSATVEEVRGKGGVLVLAPPSALQDRWARRFNDPVVCLASGWMSFLARARQRGVELPLVISDHADWEDLLATVEQSGANEVWVTHGQEAALARACRLRGLRARELSLVGYAEEEE